MKIYIVRNLPSNLTILQNKANTDTPSLTVFTMHSSPLLNLSWPKISFASDDTALHKCVAKFFENAMSPRYGKLINASKFLESYKKEGDWRKCVDSEPLKILIVNNAEPKEREFVDPIIKFISYLEKTKYYLVSQKDVEYRDLLKEDCNKYDAIILSASPLGDDIVHHHMKYYEWLSHTTKPVFGICAGHQIIGTYFGGELYKGREAENGYTDVNIVKDDPIFRGEKIPPTRQHHNDSVSCPDDFVILAESGKCRNQIMKHKRKPIYSTQFHCEKTTAGY